MPLVGESTSSIPFSRGMRVCALLVRLRARLPLSGSPVCETHHSFIYS